MASTLSQNWLTIFFAKKLKISYIFYRIILFKFHQHVNLMLINNQMMYGEIQTSNVSVIKVNIKCLIDRKISFTANLPLKLFGATIANPDTASLKFLHELFDTYLDHMLAKFEPNRMDQIVKILKTNFDKASTPFCKTFL